MITGVARTNIFGVTREKYEFHRKFHNGLFVNIPGYVS